MGWKTAMTVVRGASVADLERVGLVPDGETTTGDEASASGLGDRIGVIPVGEDLVLIGLGDVPDLENRLAETLGVEVVHGLFMSTVDYYVWKVLHAGGVRNWVWGEGEEIADEGTALPEEDSVHMLTEDALFALIEERTGIDSAAWLEGTVQWLAQSAPPSDKAKGGGFFARLRRRGA